MVDTSLRDDLQFPRTPGLLSGFDEVITTSDPTNLAIAGYSKAEIMDAIKNLKETGLSNDAQRAIQTLITHISDFSNPHKDDLTSFISNYIATLLKDIVPGTVPDAYPQYAFSPDLELQDSLVGCTCTRASTIRVMTRSGLYTTVAKNTRGTDWSTGTARVPCFPAYTLINTTLIPDTSITTGTLITTLSNLTVVAKDLSTIGVTLPDGTTNIHNLVFNGSSGTPNITLQMILNGAGSYSFSFISYTAPTDTSSTITFTIPALSTDVVSFKFDSTKLFYVSTVGALSAGYQQQVDGTIRWFVTFDTPSNGLVYSLTIAFPLVTGSSLNDTIPISMDLIQLTNTSRPAPILLVGETAAAQTITLATTNPAVTSAMVAMSLVFPWTSTTKTVSTPVEILSTPDLTFTITPQSFTCLTQSHAISSVAQVHTVCASVSSTELILGVTGSDPLKVEHTFTSTTANPTLTVPAFGGYLLDIVIYDVADKVNATEFLVNG